MQMQTSKAQQCSLTDSEGGRKREGLHQREREMKALSERENDRGRGRERRINIGLIATGFIWNRPGKKHLIKPLRGRDCR